MRILCFTSDMRENEGQWCHRSQTSVGRRRKREIVSYFVKIVCKLGWRIATEFDNQEVADDLAQNSFSGVAGMEVDSDDVRKCATCFYK